MTASSSYNEDLNETPSSHPVPVNQEPPYNTRDFSSFSNIMKVEKREIHIPLKSPKKSILKNGGNVRFKKSSKDKENITFTPNFSRLSSTIPRVTSNRVLESPQIILKPQTQLGSNSIKLIDKNSSINLNTQTAKITENSFSDIQFDNSLNYTSD